MLEKLIILGFIINIVGLTVLTVLSCRELEGLKQIQSSFTFIHSEDGKVTAVLTPQKGRERETNIFKNKQKKIDERR